MVMYCFIISTLCIVFARVSPVCSVAKIGKSITSSSNKTTTSLATNSPTENYLEKIENEPQLRIVGGHDCHHTFMVTVVVAQTWTYVCSGTLISPSFVLSSASCFLIIPGPPDLLAIIGRFNLRSKNYSAIKVKWIQPAPKYYTPDRVDVALLYLSEKIYPREGEVSYIKLPAVIHPDDLSDFCPFNLFTAAGWGNVNSNRTNTVDLSQQLKCADIPYLNNRKCKEKAKHFNPNIYLCLSDPTAKVGACYGDVGGPIFCNDIQYGIISNAMYCADPQNPTFIIRVDRELEFIHQYVRYYRSCSNSEIGKLLYISISLMTIVSNLILFEKF
ncbi:hypothetical protein WA026_003121 [Henosepilachna vigintioctopunctata]|uniref:Peptidase S1 domain-containing protein n=1 Tax=Henosepilachna vigintioctopunctata TaxID=420089 RepID=A0AAW1TM88_9CUCU